MLYCFKFCGKDEKTTLEVSSDQMDLAPSPFWRVGPLSVLYCFMFCGKDVKTTLEVSDWMDLAPSPFGVLDHCQCSIVSCFVGKT